MCPSLQCMCDFLHTKPIRWHDNIAVVYNSNKRLLCFVNFVFGNIDIEMLLRLFCLLYTQMIFANCFLFWCATEIGFCENFSAIEVFSIVCQSDCQWTE